MKTVVILGAGNVAFHLTRAMIEKTINIRQIYNRTLEKAQTIGEENKVRYTDKISEIEKADLYIISSADSAIEEISYHIPFDDVLVVHTSGSMPKEAIQGNVRKGVLYPLQTFSKKRKLNYAKIPFFIEAENQEDLETLRFIANRISHEVYEVTAEQRMKFHLSAVWVNNFVNHLYTLGQEICEENEIDFDVLRPLIEETTSKVLDMMPRDAQTGPARRNDQVVIEKHLKLLTDSKKAQLYQLLSESILKMYQP